MNLALDIFLPVSELFPARNKLLEREDDVDSDGIDDLGGIAAVLIATDERDLAVLPYEAFPDPEADRFADRQDPSIVL